MKRARTYGFGLAVVLLIVIVGAMAWRLLGKSTTQPEAPKPGVITNNNCNGDRQCFYEAFRSSCAEKTIQTTLTTIEGDPIITTAKIVTSSEGCVVEATVDGSQDKFGDGKVYSYTCKELTQEAEALWARECTGGDLDGVAHEVVL